MITLRLINQLILKVIEKKLFEQQVEISVDFVFRIQGIHTFPNRFVLQVDGFDWFTYQWVFFDVYDLKGILVVGLIVIVLLVFLMHLVFYALFFLSEILIFRKLVSNWIHEFVPNLNLNSKCESFFDSTLNGFFTWRHIIDLETSNDPTNALIADDFKLKADKAECFQIGKLSNCSLNNSELFSDAHGFINLVLTTYLKLNEYDDLMKT